VERAFQGFDVLRVRSDEEVEVLREAGQPVQVQRRGAKHDVAHALAFERGEHPQDDLVLHGATIAHRCDGQA
jgi:hypothetical protein